MKSVLLVFATVGLVALAAAPATAQDTSMSFFVTSVGSGNGADLGGLSGADQHCQTLAAAAGAGSRTWRAYLSTTGPGGGNARDRIGSGPWYNVNGALIAENVGALHSDTTKMVGLRHQRRRIARPRTTGSARARRAHETASGWDRTIRRTDRTTCTPNINSDTALDENGGVINAEGQPNRHDILTGSQTEGTATDMTCQNWTSSGEGSAMLGHQDRLTFGKPGSPWNSAHASKGCSQENLVATGGAGLTYCFAID